MSAWLSPLRYPGSQRRLVSYIRKTLSTNGVSPELFVEPFAGGASVAIQLLGEETVNKIGLADRDPLVTDFWRAVFFDTEWFIRKIRDLDVTLDRWKEFKRSARSRKLDGRQRAIACLFLNRTSFSGILHESAGPLGGFDQDSQYKIDCRFPKDTIVRRIEKLGRLRKRVSFIWNTSWRQTLGMMKQPQKSAQREKGVFYYFDPPFFDKSHKLYQYSFEDEQHVALRDVVSAIDDNWILSYDACSQVWDYYEHLGLSLSSVEIVYETMDDSRIAATEVVATNLSKLPQEAELWKKNGRRGLVRRRQ